jgi:hypothetical protein
VVFQSQTAATAPATTSAVSGNQGNSTVAASLASIPNDNTTTSRITVTILSDSSAPVGGKEVSVQKSSGPGTPTITPVPCSNGDPVDTINPADALTNSSGQACFDIKADTIGVDTFSASDVSDSVTLSNTATVEFTCSVGTAANPGGAAGNQCAVLGITQENGALTLASVPDDFNFTQISPGGDTYSTTAGLDSKNLVTVNDTRNNGGFLLQVQAGDFSDGATPTPHLIPLSDLYIGTATPANGTTPDANGIPCAGVLYHGSEYDLSSAPPSCPSSKFDIGHPMALSGDPALSSTFTTPSSFTSLNNNTLDNADDLMETAADHNGSFSQYMNFYLKVPSDQPLGTYHVTLTFTATSI